MGRCRSVAQPGSASGLGPEGRRFESSRSDHRNSRRAEMDARIFKPRKSAMQSGRGKTHEWVLEFRSGDARFRDPLMGWTSINDTTGQVRMHFETREQAIDFAKRENLTFTVEESREPKRLVKSYAQNFSPDRKQPWTH